MYFIFSFYCVSTLFLWISPVPPKSALPHGHCRHQSRQAEVLTLRKMFKAFLSSLFADQDSKKMSPHPTWSLMRRWKSAWDLDRGCNKRENAGRPQTFALHPHFLNEPHAKHIWYSQFSVHMQISMFANIRFSCWSAVSANHTNNKNDKSDLKKTQFSVFLTKNGKLNAIKSVFSPLFSRLISAAVTTCIEMVGEQGKGNKKLRKMFPYGQYLWNWSTWPGSISFSGVKYEGGAVPGRLDPLPIIFFPFPFLSLLSISPTVGPNFSHFHFFKWGRDPVFFPLGSRYFPSQVFSTSSFSGHSAHK